MFIDRTWTGAAAPGGRASLAAVAALALVVAACGGSTRHRRPSAAPPASARHRRSAAAPAPRPRRERRRLHGTRGDDHVLDLGRPPGDQEPAGDRRRVPRGQPEDHGQRDRLRLGAVLGQAPDRRSRAATRPDVFAMDGPLFPDYQSRDVLLDLKPFIDRDGYDLTQLADQAVADFTTPDGQFGLPRDLNVVALYYNKTMFDAAGHPLPGRHVGLGEARRGRQEADRSRTPTARPTQWGFYTETTDMENYWSELVWQNGGDIVSRRPQDEPRRQRRGGRRHPVPPGPDLEGQGHARRGDHRRARRRLRAGPGGDGVQRLVARRDPPGRRARLRDRAAAEGPGRPGARRSTRPGAVVYKGTKNPDAAWEFVKYLASPAAQDAAHGAQGVAAGEQGGPRRAVRDVVRRRAGPRRRDRLRPAQAVVQGLQRVDDRAPGRARHERLQRAEQDGQAGAHRRRCRQLDGILAGQ